MLCYVYQDHELPEDCLQFNRVQIDIKKTEHPDLADVFWVPVNLFQLKPERLPTLRYWQGNEHRHAMIEIAERFQTTNSRALFIRCALRESMLAEDPCSVAWPWPVEPMDECVDVQPKYDVGFCGWRTPLETTRRAVMACERADLNCWFVVHKDFYGHRPDDDPETIRRRAQYKEALGLCRLWLCPESLHGVLRYRVYEAMAAARVPVIIGDDFVLPWEDKIDWDNCSIIIRSKNVRETGVILRAMIRQGTDFAAMGRLAQREFERWLHRDRWPELLGELVRSKMR